MTYEEAIAFWYGRINYEVRAAGEKDLKLERMRALLRLVGDPHDRLRLVHVTGTKGKGSTCAMIAAGLQEAGYRVGLFTSPHLVQVEERIRVSGEPISREELTKLLERIAPIVRQLESGPWPPPTFFEISTALGFLHFVQRRCDVAVVEVGLGGRFDSTNVCRPLVSVITNIGLDHMAQLGNTLEAIAYQKAGIIKSRVPVVSGVTQPGPQRVIEVVAKEMQSRLCIASVDKPKPAIALLGEHQAANAAVAIAAFQLLRECGFSIPDRAMTRGFAEVKWPARIEIVSRNPIVILDSAHNVPSAIALVTTLRQSFPIVGRKQVVFAVSSDKQYEEMLSILAEYFDHFHLTKYGNNPRSVQPEKLAALLANASPPGSFTVHANAVDAWASAWATTPSDGLVCVTGSVFLAGELQPFLRSAVTASRLSPEKTN